MLKALFKYEIVICYKKEDYFYACGGHAICQWAGKIMAYLWLFIETFRFIPRFTFFASFFFIKFKIEKLVSLILGK